MWTCGVYKQSLSNPNKLILLYQSEPKADMPARGELPPVSGRALAIADARRNGPQRNYARLNQPLKYFVNKGRRD